MSKSKKRPHDFVGRNIAKLRRNLDLTQEDLAEKADISISMTKDIERGVAEGGIGTREKIAAALGCEIMDLYRTNSSNEDQSPKESAADREWEKLINENARLKAEIESLKNEKCAIPIELQKSVLLELYNATNYIQALPFLEIAEKTLNTKDYELYKKLCEIAGVKPDSKEKFNKAIDSSEQARKRLIELARSLEEYL